MTKRMGAEAGQDLVEYALVLPLFLLLVTSVIEFGILFYQYSTVVNAAKEGARAGIVMSSQACNDACVANKIDTAARKLMVGLQPERLTITPTFYMCNWAGSGSHPCVQVKVTYKTTFATKMLIDAVGGKGDVTLESTATMQREY